MDLTLHLGPARKIVATVGAFALSMYFTPLIRNIAIRYGVLDTPNNELKAHKEPTPYLGGVSIWLSFLFALAVTFQFTRQVLGILLGASIVVTVGLFDDLKVLSPRAKLVGQIIATFVLIKSGILIELHFLTDWEAVLLTVLWMVGVTNSMNLIDVSDGLAAGVACIAGIFLYVIAIWNHVEVIAVVTSALVGAALGFLRYNRPPARIFMGDTGSLFLGFMLAALAMIGKYTAANKLAALAPVVILGVPIFDTLFVIGVRLRRRLPVMRGSPDHFAVRLRRNGYAPWTILLIGYGAAAALGAAGLAICRSDQQTAGIILGVVAALGIAAAVALARLGRGPDPP